ncbi:MAG: bifunctional UDP-N-acetylglucosamine diphosphorylase/glucosamine-1-phosphate N-acetyltransferase GlmU, partial [Chloroflexota bacterium]|nr:bifunctional UDP-N-acetylglucosamine diphosphorylase/glucosamine-1-phosphate N-acetyltransferase GlmU [Chloroflexota bacterium]
AGEDIAFVEQDKLLGTGHALLSCREALEGQADTLLVLYGDDPLIRTETLSRLITRHRGSGATLTLLTYRAADPSGYGFGRILRDSQGKAIAIIEEKDATPAQKAIPELNCGFYCLQTGWAWSALERLKLSPQGEYYLTDLVEMATRDDRKVETQEVEDGEEIMGINNRLQLAEVEAALRRRKLEELMLGGVTILDPATTYIEATVEVGQDSVILPGCILQGCTRIGTGCTIGPYSVIRDSCIADSCKVTFSFLEEATMEEGADIGPYSHLRPGAHIGKGTHLGNFVEVKNSRLGQHVHVGHFSYLGDATVGDEANIGAGTITCNFDGQTKNPTTIGEGAFIGSDTLLIAPVQVGAHAKTGAGSVVTRDIPPKTVAVGVPARVIRRLEDQE